MRPNTRRNKMEETSSFKQMFADKLDTDKLAIGMITTVACWLVGSAVNTTYTKFIVEQRSTPEITE